MDGRLAQLGESRAQEAGMDRRRGVRALHKGAQSSHGKEILDVHVGLVRRSGDLARTLCDATCAFLIFCLVIVMAQSPNKILGELKANGIIDDNDDTVNQVYTGYEDTQKGIDVCRSYLIDYYCAVFVSKIRMLDLYGTVSLPEKDNNLYVAKIIAIKNAIQILQTSPPEPTTKEEYKELMQIKLLQEYLEMKKESCVRATDLGFGDDVVNECQAYVRDLSQFISYIPDKFIKLETVDVSFVGSLDKEAYNKSAGALVLKKKQFLHFIEKDLEALESWWTLDQQPQGAFDTKIDLLNNNGGFAISYGSGHDGYNTTFRICDELIKGGWEIVDAEMFYPRNISNEPISSFKGFNTVIKGNHVKLEANLKTIVGVVSKPEEVHYLTNIDGYFNGTVIIRMNHRDKPHLLEIWSLASRDDFHDVAYNHTIKPNDSLELPICKMKSGLDDLTNMTPDTLMKLGQVTDPNISQIVNAIIKKKNLSNKNLDTNLKNNIDKTISFMRNSIYTTDMYHALRYIITRRYSFETQTNSNLYPFKTTSFESEAELVKDSTNETKPAIIINQFKKALSTTGAQTLHVFATLKETTSNDDRTTIANMKTIAYANRLSKRLIPIVREVDPGYRKSQRHHP
jgi:hypothetical protein